MEYIVAHDDALAFAGIGDVIADFLGLVRIGKIHGAQAAGEPGDVERVAVDLLGRLVRAEAVLRCRLSFEGDDERGVGDSLFSRSNFYLTTKARRTRRVRIDIIPNFALFVPSL